MAGQDRPVDPVLAVAETQHCQQALEDPGEVSAVEGRMLRMDLFQGAEAGFRQEDIDPLREFAWRRKGCNQAGKILAVSRFACRSQQAGESL